MKIKSVSCTQFAGINDREVEFSDGLNVICGKNESGKSTLVNLIARTLFQDAKLDKRSDRDFMNLYFPGQTKDKKVTGDFADGKITLEAEDGVYTLSKEWGDDPRCTLSTPSGIVRDADTVREILDRLLRYGEGVYSDMLFSSQRNTDAALQTILDAAKRTDAKQEVIDAVSKAFAESGGIPIDAIGQRIDGKIDGLMGKHWDAEREAPVRRAVRWSRDTGDILIKYYALEDARDRLGEISKREAELDAASNRCAAAEKSARDAEVRYDGFLKYSSKLSVRKGAEQQIEHTRADIARKKAVLSDWEDCVKKLRIAGPLQSEKLNRDIKDKYASAAKLHDFIMRGEKYLSENACPADGEIKLAERAEREIPRLENRLGGMNIDAAIHMLNGNSVEIVSARTGEPLVLSGESVSISEAAIIRVPGVLEMQLSPANVDVASVRSGIAEREEILKKIFKKYDVGSVARLKERRDEISAAKMKVDAARERLGDFLAGESYDGLKAAAERISDEPRTREEIVRDISAICPDGDLASFIGIRTDRVGSYKSEYSDLDGLGAKISESEKSLEKLTKSLDELKDIPPEYLGISDPAGHLEKLNQDRKAAQSGYEKSLVDKAESAANLEEYRSNLPSDPSEDAERAEREFSEAKESLGHWLHIKSVFDRLKNEVRSNPARDIAESFARYLGAISDGRVSGEFSGDFDIEILSGDRLLDYQKLSEGTKETVSLAFRLAVLDHLFPDGGVIVFDDPFTDMDADRTKQSCALIKECAKRHQVIFLTCKEECAEMLGDNVIRI